MKIEKTIATSNSNTNSKRVASKLAKTTSKVPKKRTNIKLKTSTRPKCKNEPEDYVCDMYGFLGNAILESEGPSNINRKNSAMKHVDFFSKTLLRLRQTQMTL